MTGQRAHNFKDLAGVRKARLLVLRLDESKTERRLIYWWCRCDCGVEKSIAATNLRPRGKTVSCGCYRSARSKERRPSRARITPEARGLAQVHHAYRRGAEHRGLSWGLSREDVYALLRANCTYCDSPPKNYFSSTRVKNGHRYTARLRYNGIDRVDNSLGYSQVNAVTCCPDCNYMKGTMSVDAFREQVLKINVFWVTRLHTVYGVAA